MNRDVRRQIILDTVSDLVADFTYYDRKEDEELPRGAIEAAIERGDVTIDQIVDHFRFMLTTRLER